jgi:methionine-rich copper-binding protein CopC
MLGSRTQVRRAFRRVGAVGALAVGAVLVLAAPASAHAVLVSSTPNAAQILDAARRARQPDASRRQSAR